MIELHKFEFSNGVVVSGSQIIRGDDAEFNLVIVDEDHKPDLPTDPLPEISLRFVAKHAADYPTGAPKLIKQGEDFAFTLTGKVLQASFSLTGLETSCFADQTLLRYEIERRLRKDGETRDRVTTVERGTISIVPDIAV